MERGRFVKQILQYILLRQTASCLEISDPHMTPSMPAGWTDEDEAIWQEWIVYTFPYHTWLTEVMNPVFGLDVRLWEARCEGWRLELAHFLPWWVQRSMDIVRAFDPTQIEPEAEEEAGMDAYLLDHGSSKQRKAALRSGAY